MKKILIAICGIAAAAAVVYVLITSGVIQLETMQEEDEESVSQVVISVEDLADGYYYVWHNDNTDDITADLEGAADSEVFKLCPEGDINWDSDSSISHTIWFTSSNDTDIPTLYPGDKLLYISSTYVPSDGINWERFADYGYTIGVANMASDNSGHYYIVNSGEKTVYEGYVYSASDADGLNSFTNVTALFLDQVGSVKIRENLMSDGGTVMGLEKDKSYLCEWYTGTYYQDFKMVANVHAFCSLESFTTYDYDFLHSNCISVTIPSWLKTGYYYLDSIGLFRYVSSTDAAIYNGEAYDANVDWNDPIILYDENGFLEYDPSTDYSSSDYSQSAQSAASSADNDDTGFGGEDAGAEYYEDFSGEIVVTGWE